MQWKSEKAKRNRKNLTVKSSKMQWKSETTKCNGNQKQQNTMETP